MAGADTIGLATIALRVKAMMLTSVVVVVVGVTVMVVVVAVMVAVTVNSKKAAELDETQLKMVEIFAGMERI